MKQFTTEPDEWNRWIYDSTHPEYDTPRAKDLRAQRKHALEQVPSWMWAMTRDKPQEEGK